MTTLKQAIAIHQLDIMKKRARANGAVEVSPLQAEMIRQQNYQDHISNVEAANWKQVQVMCDIRDIIKEAMQK